MSPFEQKGELDAQRGITVCDFHDPEQRRLWARGHDRAVAAGLGPYPRFGLICRRAGASVAQRPGRPAGLRPKRWPLPEGR